MAFDAVLRNLAAIGESVRTLPEVELLTFADAPWASIAELLCVIVHEYFRIPESL